MSFVTNNDPVGISINIIKKFFEFIDDPLLSSVTNNIPAILIEQAPIVFNGNPINGRDQFIIFLQEALILCQHSLSNYDVHILPDLSLPIGVGSTTGRKTSAVVSGKVRFDENGKRRKDLQGISTPTNIMPNRTNWYTFCANLIIDYNTNMIDSFNYRIVYKPEDSIITI